MYVVYNISLSLNYHLDKYVSMNFRYEVLSTLFDINPNSPRGAFTTLVMLNYLFSRKIKESVIQVIIVLGIGVLHRHD